MLLGNNTIAMQGQDIHFSFSIITIFVATVSMDGL